MRISRVQVAFVLIASTTFLASTVLSSRAQFSVQELKRRSEIEQQLKTAEILRWEKIGEGVTDPFRLYLECEEGDLSGCWKNPQGVLKGYLEGWRYEIAAYEMDKLLGLNMIPPTVERIFNGKRGSFQFWINKGMSDLERMEQGIEIPQEKARAWSRQKYLQRTFDSLIGNEDRTQQNIRYTPDWRMFLIDHSRSFRSSRKYADHLMYGSEGIKEQKLIRTLPRGFVERIRALDYSSIEKAVGSHLTKREIEAVLKRRRLLLREIQKMIEARGEDKFFY